jgi:hypothetical protein
MRRVVRRLPSQWLLRLAFLGTVVDRPDTVGVGRATHRRKVRPEACTIIVDVVAGAGLVPSW